LAPSADTKALLGLETSSAVSTLVKPRRYGREFRPLAVLAVTLSWPSAHREAEVAVESLELARRDALAVIQASGAWVTHAGGGSLLAYCGYPGVTERPIDAAVALARALSGLALHEGVHLGMGLHAEVALTEPEMS